VKVRFSEAALRDLRRIGDYIAEDSPLRAREFVRELRSRAMHLAENPLAFPLVRRHEHSDIRRHVFRNYLIFYLVKGQIVHIVHILHGAQDYESILFPDA
jgi:addiction module RelE/StbE family toxin